MKPRTLLTTGVLACVALLLAAHPARAHKFYASLAQVEYDAGAGRVEVSMRVFADDLELALTRRAGAPVRLERAKERDRLVIEYLREKFELKNRAGERKELRLVGVEVEREVAWLYFEADMPEGLKGARLRDEVLFELFAKQVNVVDFKWTGGKSDLVFVRGDGERAVPDIKTGRK